MTTAAVDPRVRMTLYDYDAAPDGCGTYKKLDAEFPSQEAALEHRRRYMHNMYWGAIKKIDGTLLLDLEEGSDPNDPRDYEEWRS